ncbi:hypothetical protein [Lacipirellula parvula]|nr:hypothetical protein [Lacipirellula parvula]
MAEQEDSGFPILGCLIFAGAAVVLLGALLVVGRILGPRAVKRQRAARVESMFDSAKGRSSAYVFMEAGVIKKLSEDEESVEELVELNLSSIDFHGVDMTPASKLSKLKTIHAYDCTDIEDLLSALQGSTSLEELSFDSMLLSDEGIQLLATFPNLKKVYFTYIADKKRVDQLRATIPNVVVEVEETD